MEKNITSSVRRIPSLRVGQFTCRNSWRDSKTKVLSRLSIAFNL